MRLWHRDILPILPKIQLVDQWSDCQKIAKSIASYGTPNDMYVNRVKCYPIEHLASYCYMVMWELEHRDMSPSPDAVKSLTKNLGVYLEQYVDPDSVFESWHTDRYLFQCCSLLEEIYDCGAIPYDEWMVIEDYICEKI